MRNFNKMYRTYFLRCLDLGKKSAMFRIIFALVEKY